MPHRPRDVHAVRRPLVQLEASRRVRHRRRDLHVEVIEICGPAPLPELSPAASAAALLAAVVAIGMVMRRLLRRWRISS